MSKASFLASMGIAKMGAIGDAITSAIISFDPETASAAQITEYRNKCDEIAHRVARAESDVTTANTAVSGLQVKLDRDRAAAKALRAVIQSSTDQAVIGLKTQQATAIINQMKEIGGQEMDGSASGTLFEAKVDLTQAQADLAEWQSVHQQAVTQLTTAESTLKHARDDMERAQRDQERARARQRQQEEDQNLRGGLNQGAGIAIGAMQEAANKARQDARAATLQADALKNAKGGDVDSIVAETLAKDKPAANVLDDLNRL